MRRKSDRSWAELREVLHAVRSACITHPVTEDVHDRGVEIAERYGFSVYDSMIVAAALLVGCKILLSEDLQNRQVIDGTLTVRDPFVAGVG